MKSAWLTDIHLNFLKDRQVKGFLNALGKESADNYLISGDIGEADSVIKYLKLLDSILDRPVYVVLGNHDFYKGSIEVVRSELSEYVNHSRNIVWMNKIEFIELTDKTALIGHDSWADGRIGDFYGSMVELNDFHLIDELKLKGKAARIEAMQKLADEAADHFKQNLPKILKRFQNVIVLTHVPPFKEATWHEGSTSGDDWLPFFSSRIVGDVLKRIMNTHPDHNMTVLCGHTHSSGKCQILPNLKVLTGGAEYGIPAIQQILNIT